MIDEKILNDMLEQLHTQIDEIEIDMDDLQTAEWDSNPYGVEPELVGTSGEYTYDEDEYSYKQFDKMIDWIMADGLYEYVEGYDNDICLEYELPVLKELTKEMEQFGF